MERITKIKNLSNYNDIIDDLLKIVNGYEEFEEYHSNTDLSNLRNKIINNEDILYKMKVDNEEYVFAIPVDNFHNSRIILYGRYVTENSDDFAITKIFYGEHRYHIEEFRRAGYIIPDWVIITNIKGLMDDIDILPICLNLKCIVINYLPIQVVRSIANILDADNYQSIFKKLCFNDYGLIIDKNRHKYSDLVLDLERYHQISLYDYKTIYEARKCFDPQDGYSIWNIRSNNVNAILAMNILIFHDYILYIPIVVNKPMFGKYLFTKNMNVFMDKHKLYDESLLDATELTRIYAYIYQSAERYNKIYYKHRILYGIIMSIFILSYHHGTFVNDPIIDNIAFQCDKFFDEIDINIKSDFINIISNMLIYHNKDPFIPKFKLFLSKSTPNMYKFLREEIQRYIAI